MATTHPHSTEMPNFSTNDIRPETIPTAVRKPRRSAGHKKAIVLAVIACFWSISP